MFWTVYLLIGVALMSALWIAVATGEPFGVTLLLVLMVWVWSRPLAKLEERS